MATIAPPPPALFATQAQAPAETRNDAIVRAAFADWRAGRSAIFDLLGSDFRWTIAGSGPSAGTYDRKSFETLLAPFNAQLAAPLKPTLQSLLSSGDQVVVRFTATAPLKRGGTYRNDYAWFLTMRGGRIVAVTAFLDLPTFDAVREAGAAGR